MCSGFPCKCCKPVKEFDTHFDKEKVWKCFFQDMQEENPFDFSGSVFQSLGYGSLEFFRAFMQDYRFAGARPIQTPCADSFYKASTFSYPNSTVKAAKAIMARMKFDQPDPLEWKPQRITTRAKFDFKTPIGRQNTVTIIIGDEHDDYSQTYTTSFVAWPSIVFRIESSGTLPYNDAAINCNILQSEGGYFSPASSFAGFKLPGTYTIGIDSPSFNLGQTAEFEFVVERLSASTRFHLTLDGVVVGLTSGFIPDAVEWLELPITPLRESPNYRFLCGGMQLAPSSGNRIPASFDRISVKTELIE
jgi:hypothetical protein